LPSKKQISGIGATSLIRPCQQQ